MIKDTAVSQNKFEVSFCIFTYNHEEFIKETINSILMQTQRDLEIIISDDCSTDKTYEIAKSHLQATDNSNSICLLQTPRNLGVIDHVHWVISQTSGDLIITAAGDDISECKRTETIISAWNRHEQPALITSDFIYIDSQGEEIPNLKKSISFKNEEIWAGQRNLLRNVLLERGTIIGSTAAYNKSLFSEFPEIEKSNWQEDDILAFRASLIGKTIYIPHKLLRYRIHSANSWVGKNLNTEEQAKRLRSRYLVRTQNIVDLVYYAENNRSELNRLVFLIVLSLLYIQRIQYFTKWKSKSGSKFQKLIFTLLSLPFELIPVFRSFALSLRRFSRK